MSPHERYANAIDANRTHKYAYQLNIRSKRVLVRTSYIVAISCNAHCSVRVFARCSDALINAYAEKPSLTVLCVAGAAAVAAYVFDLFANVAVDHEGHVVVMLMWILILLLVF